MSERHPNSLHEPSPRRALWRLTLPVLVASLAGCGGMSTSGTISSPNPPTQPPPAATQSGNVTVSPRYVALGPGQTVRFLAAAPANETLQWSVSGVIGGNATVGTVDSNGNYKAPAGLQYGVNAVIAATDPNAPQTNTATAVAAIIAPGTATSTANPQVATYSIYLPSPGDVSIDFGPDVNYGLTTWSQPTPSPNGGEVSVYVAGMMASSTYHMRAQVTLKNGSTFTDSDQTFSTGSPPVTAPVTVTAQNGQAPQPGIVMFDTLVPHMPSQAFATDLQGNVIWTYSYQGGSNYDAVQPIKLLPNGHFLILISYASSAPLYGASIPSATIDSVREVDLAGNTIREVTIAQLAAALAAKGYNFNLGSLHHDVLPLPNGHWILIASLYKSITGLSGFSGTTNVLGDVLIDLDPSGQVAWVWNTFDHLDINRHPYLFPDWTHSNALLYSADDHNLLLSMRHQSWIVKIDYADGQGSGNILWRLGEAGDFTLQNGVDPTDWFYAQHGPNYFSLNTTGAFRIGVMDNGDDRQFPGGVRCGTTGAPACYSTASVYQVDESSMTATLTSHYKAPASMYSYFGGNVQPLANGDLQADFCATLCSTQSGSVNCAKQGGGVIQELNLNGATPQLIWQAATPGTAQYRAQRLPSLYPGVQW